MTIKRSLAAIFAVITVLCAVSSESKAAGMGFWLRGISPINRPLLAAPGTPGRAIDVALGLADFVVGRTAADPAMVVITDATMAPNILVPGSPNIDVPSIVVNTTDLSLTINTSAYGGGFWTGQQTAYETDRLGNPDITRPIPNVMRSRIMIADSTAMSCVVATTGTQPGITSCSPTRYVVGIPSAWNPVTGAMTLRVTAKAGTTPIAAANAVLLRHYPENAAITVPYLALQGQPDGSSNPAVDRNWDWTSYLNPPNQSIIAFDGGSSSGLVRVTQSKTDWSSNVLGSASGVANSTIQAYSLDHDDINWTPFRDAIQLTVAADAPSGSQLTVVESIPSIVSSLAACGVSQASCSQVTLPFNGGSVTTNFAGAGVGIRKFWGVFNASNPDSMFNVSLNSVSGNTLTFDAFARESGLSPTTFSPIRSTVKAGDKIWLFRWPSQIDATVTGTMCDLTDSRVVSPEDLFFFVRAPYTTTLTSGGSTFNISGCGSVPSNPTGKQYWSRNLLTNMGFAQNTNHGDLIQTSSFTGHSSLSITNNVVQAVHLNGMYNNSNPRDWTATNSYGAWTSDIEIAYNIMDGSGIASIPWYWQDSGVSPIQMILKDEATGNLRVVWNPNGVTTYSLTNGRFTSVPVQGSITQGDTMMVSGFPVGMTALNGRNYKVDRVYMGANASSALMGAYTNAFDTSKTFTASINTTASSSTITGDTTAMTTGLPITINGTEYTITSVSTPRSVLSGSATLSATVPTTTSMPINATMPLSFTLANTSTQANALSGPYIGYVTAVANATTTSATNDANEPAARKVCVSDASQIAPDMQLVKPGSTTSTAYSAYYSLTVVAVDYAANCVTLSGPLNNGNNITSGTTLYFATWSRPAQNTLVHMHHLYMKKAAFSLNSTSGSLTASSYGPVPAATLFYTALMTRKSISVHDLYEITDNEGTYGDGVVADYPTMPEPLRFAAGGIGGVPNYTRTWNVNDYPYLVPMIGSTTAPYPAWTMEDTWNALSSTNTDFSNPSYTGRYPTLTGVTAFNPPCPAPTGLTATPAGVGNITLAYSAATTCGTGAGAGTNGGETVSIDGGAWSDPLGVIHSGSTLTGLTSGTHTFAVRSMDAPDDFNTPRNPGASSLTVSATVQ